MFLCQIRLKLKNSISKLSYLLSSLQKFFTAKGLECPSCGQKNSKTVDRKYLVTTLQRCNNCSLLFRTPTTSQQESTDFYRKKYLTCLPPRKCLYYLKDAASKKEIPSSNRKVRNVYINYSRYLKVLNALSNDNEKNLFEFGCGDGCGSWLLRNAGYTVKAFDISELKCDYAKKYLNVDATCCLEQITGVFDIFFSAHVLEHIPHIQETINYGWQMLRPGGLFVAFTPNGSFSHKRKSFKGWHQRWGQIHPNYLDEVYYNKVFGAFPRIIASCPYPIDALKQWNSVDGEHKICDLEGWELLVVVRKPKIKL
jgi:2-polyprenyl-3-methyl-5-hydroxy-6-metoxy-1,4-benzoquinol methylase